MVLGILFLRKGEFFHTPICSALGFLCLNKAALFIIHLAFQILDLLFKSGCHLFATFDGKLLSLIQFCLHILDLAVHCTPISLCTLSIFLLCTQLICQTCSINHCFFCFVFSNSTFIQHFLKIRMHSLHFRVKL